jgi:hypothetical protein
MQIFRKKISGWNNNMRGKIRKENKKNYKTH